MLLLCKVFMKCITVPDNCVFISGSHPSQLPQAPFSPGSVCPVSQWAMWLTRPSIPSWLVDGSPWWCLPQKCNNCVSQLQREKKGVGEMHAFSSLKRSRTLILNNVCVTQTFPLETLLFFKTFCLHHKQDGKTTLRIEENICKWRNWQKIHLRNIQALMQLNIKTTTT